MKDNLSYIFSQFNVTSHFSDFRVLNSGHINDTYLIITSEKPYYILQKINSHVFKNAKDLINNKVAISNYLLEEKHFSPNNTLSFINSIQGEFYYKDKESNYWNLSIYIDKSKTFHLATSTTMAEEAGRVTGSFINDTANFNGNITNIMPNFHSMKFRFQEFDQALINVEPKRKEEASKWIDFAQKNRVEMLQLEIAIKEKNLPLRVTHNDTKISNILFSEQGSAICLIDYDTIMKGALHYDYGDAIRTICSTAIEDETNLSKIDFNTSFFEAYTKGFLKALKTTITQQEVDYLPLSPKTVTFIMGLRLLTDFLNNDIYYKTRYPLHNLDRAKNQFTLTQKIQEKEHYISDFISSAYTNL